MKQGTLTENELYQRLVKSKKIMNKVESGNFETGNINAPVSHEINESLVTEGIPSDYETKINSSKLADPIKKIMLNKPIPKLNIDHTPETPFIKNAKQMLIKEGLVKDKKRQVSENKVLDNGVDMNTFSMLIENAVRKVLDEKLNQILTAHEVKSVNENLVLKVGDSVFKGKIVGVNKIK